MQYWRKNINMKKKNTRHEQNIKILKNESNSPVLCRIGDWGKRKNGYCSIHAFVYILKVNFLPEIGFENIIHELDFVEAGMWNYNKFCFFFFCTNKILKHKITWVVIDLFFNYSIFFLEKYSGKNEPLKIAYEYLCRGWHSSLVSGFRVATHSGLYFHFVLFPFLFCVSILIFLNFTLKHYLP